MLFFEKMTVDECDVRSIIAEMLIEATSRRLCECIRVRELAATHRLEQMRRLRKLEKQKAWKRDVGFDRIETAAEMDAERFLTSLVSEPFYSKLCNPKWPYNPKEFTLETKVDVERQRMEIVLSQPALRPQCDPSPRRFRYGVRGTRNAATVARDRYGVG